MADRDRSAFMTQKSKRQRTEDDEDDFHFVNKHFIYVLKYLILANQDGDEKSMILILFFDLYFDL